MNVYWFSPSRWSGSYGRWFARERVYRGGRWTPLVRVRRRYHLLADSGLVAHARRELDLLGEEPWIADGLVAVVAAFASMGHSGGSAAVAERVVGKLLRFEPLTALTDDPDEWADRSQISGTPLWQNVRDSRAVSVDGGKTYTLVGDAAETVHASAPAGGAPCPT